MVCCTARHVAGQFWHLSLDGSGSERLSLCCTAWHVTILALAAARWQWQRPPDGMLYRTARGRQIGFRQRISASVVQARLPLDSLHSVAWRTATDYEHFKIYIFQIQYL